MHDKPGGWMGGRIVSGKNYRVMFGVEVHENLERRISNPLISLVPFSCFPRLRHE